MSEIFTPSQTSRPNYSWKQRFDLLSEVRDSVGETRYKLCPPDFFQHDWSIFDRESAHDRAWTICQGGRGLRSGRFMRRAGGAIVSTFIDKNLLSITESFFLDTMPGLLDGGPDSRKNSRNWDQT